MARKKIKLSSGVFFVALLIGANILLLLPQEHTKRLNYFFVRVTAPLLNLFPRPQDISDETVSISQYNELRRSYENLQVQFENLGKTNDTLAGIRQHLPDPGTNYVIASISKVSIDGQRSEFVINKGSRDGLKKGQYVISAENGSVIGIIIALSEKMARVKLVTDAKQHILVSICRNGVELIDGLMIGNNQMQGKIPHVETDKDIRADDSVFAKFNAGFLETSLMIGTITEIKEDDWEPTLWDITVTPIDNLKSLTDVAVVIIDMDTSESNEDK